MGENEVTERQGLWGGELVRRLLRDLSPKPFPKHPLLLDLQQRWMRKRAVHEGRAFPAASRRPPRLGPASRRRLSALGPAGGAAGHHPPGLDCHPRPKDSKPVLRPARAL